jgi:hypothetical protein
LILSCAHAALDSKRLASAAAATPLFNMDYPPSFVSFASLACADRLLDDFAVRD